MTTPEKEARRARGERRKALAAKDAARIADAKAVNRAMQAMAERARRNAR